MNEERRGQIEQMRQAPDEMAALVQNLSETELTTVYILGEWTVAQNVHHIAEAQSVAYFRFKVMALGDHPTVTPFNQDDFARTPESTSADIADSLAMLRAVNRRWARLAESLRDEQWERVGLHPEAGEISPASIFPYYANHTQVHINQIRQTLAARES
jgi:hypothetical protein